MNDANRLQFKDIYLYNNLSDPNSNYEYLFNLTNSVGADPDPSSFFNVQTLKQFIDLGDAVPNILKNTSLVFGVDFTLSQEWETLTQTLGLSDSRQTYLMWLWLDTAWDLTF